MMISICGGIMSKRTMLLVLMGFLLLLVLTGCGTSTPVPTSNGTGSTSTSGETTTVLDGQTIMNNACQTCHGLAVIYGQQQSADGWTQIVDNMITRGAVLTADERTTLIAYLAATYK